MKSIPIKFLLFTLLLLPQLGHATSTEYAQKGNTSATHELPRADQCSVITIHIRESALALKEVVKEISSLESTISAVAERNKSNEQLLSDNEQQLELMQVKASALREQIDLQEQQLEICLQK